MTDSEHQHDQHPSHKASDSGQSHTNPPTPPIDQAGHTPPGHAVHDRQVHEENHLTHTHPPEHAQHTDHAGHEQMFRNRFWGSLLLSIPVLGFSMMI